MTVYDTAHELARGLQKSREYLEYKEMKDKVYADPEMKDKIEEFEKIRYEAQVLAIQGEKQDVAKMAKLEELYNILLNNKDIKKFFDTEVRFNVLLADINKIIGDAVKDVL